jgi:predicted DNA-binding transcriptional regulator AlpA
MELTFDQLPTAVSMLYTKLENIERLLQQKNEPEKQSDQWFDLTQLCNYLPDKPAKATVYGWIHASTIPCHKGQKKLRFLKSEIDTWLMKGRKKTLSQIAGETDEYLTRKAK